MWISYDPNAIPVNVPPPANYFQPHPQTATFSINYIPNGGTDPFGDPCLTFPDEAKTAFSAAANFWSSLLTSPVPIRITACWAPLGGTILGGSSSLYSVRDFSGSPQANTRYPAALADALWGNDFAPASYDMAIVYSSDYAANFYYGTGPVPGDKIDFTTVVMHEIGHGLGFAGSMQYCSGVGMWGSLYYCTFKGDIYPDSYDRFAVDAAGHSLIDSAFYANNSTALGSALISNSVYFTGENAKAANGGSNVKLYAPSGWQDGSSYSHLDFFTYFLGANALMVYAIGDGTSIHDPGPVGLGVLKDVGWAPFAPGGLTAVAQGNNKVILNWTSNSRNQTGFRVERSASGSSEWAQIGTTTAAAYTYTDNVTPGSFYFYRVRSYHALGDSLPSNVATLPLAAPGALTAIASAPSQVDLAWSDIDSRETSYEIVRSLGGAADYQPLVVLPANSTAYNDTTANPGMAYDYKVRATSSANLSPSPWSTASAVTQLNPPLGLAVVEAVYPAQVTLSWQDTNNNETGYQVESSLDGTSGWTVMCAAPADATGCSGTGLAEATPYFFRVRAVNAVAESAVASASATTALLPPTGLVAASLPGPVASVNLYWVNHSSLATAYELQRSADGLNGWTDVPPEGLSSTDTSYSDLDVTEGQVYFYRLRATAGASGPTSPFTPVVGAVTGPNWIFIAVINR